VETGNSDIVVKPEDIYTFCFTSGTTGPPKAALIKHSNTISGATSFIVHKDFHFNKDDVHLSYLPLPHLM
jgi:long-chain acyl-CoA synthetase